MIHEERDLGVTVSEDFKVGKQCSVAAKKGNQILRMIWRSFECKSKDIIVKLYKSLDRLHLDFCIQAWKLHQVNDIVNIEKVQAKSDKNDLGM